MKTQPVAGLGAKSVAAKEAAEMNSSLLAVILMFRFGAVLGFLGIVYQLVDYHFG